MRAYEIHNGFGLDNLNVTERPQPQPGPHQVLVKVGACSLNYRDLLTVQGQYNPRQPLPLIPLSDGAGVVEAVGPNVSRVAVGDRVAAIFAQHWLAGEPSFERIRLSTLGGPLDGLLTDYVVLSEQGVVTVPEHLSLLEAATLPCAAVTAWSALTKPRPLLAGETVLVQGTGGVALFALQFAKLMGATVIVTSSSDEKLAQAADLGADHGINYRTEPDWHKATKRLTFGAGADRVIEVGGAGTFEKSLAAVRMGGTVATIGVLAGNAAPLSVIPILMSSLTVQGITVGSRDDFLAMNRAIQAHKLRPVIDTVFEFEEVPQAFALMQSGGHVGKIVISLEH